MEACQTQFSQKHGADTAGQKRGAHERGGRGNGATVTADKFFRNEAQKKSRHVRSRLLDGGEDALPGMGEGKRLIPAFVVLHPKIFAGEVVNVNTCSLIGCLHVKGQIWDGRGSGDVGVLGGGG